LIVTLLMTMFIEGVIVSGYAIGCKKPLVAVLLTSILANVVTQSLLWVVLNLFFQHYVITLSFAEILIWLMESFMLYHFSSNQLNLREAVFLSMFMNSCSFVLGLFVPV